MLRKILILALTCAFADQEHKNINVITQQTQEPKLNQKVKNKKQGPILKGFIIGDETIEGDTIVDPDCSEIRLIAYFLHKYHLEFDSLYTREEAVHLKSMITIDDNLSIELSLSLLHCLTSFLHIAAIVREATADTRSSNVEPKWLPTHVFFTLVQLCSIIVPWFIEYKYTFTPQKNKKHVFLKVTWKKAGYKPYIISSLILTASAVVFAAQKFELF